MRLHWRCTEADASAREPGDGAARKARGSARIICNWPSGGKKLPLCYNTAAWDCDFNKSGFRLPTEPGAQETFKTASGVNGYGLYDMTGNVWQYVNPVVRGGIFAQGEVPGKDVRGHLFNAVFKVHCFAPDHPGLAGRDLTPKGVIELPASQRRKTGLDKADAPAGGRGRGRGRA